MMALQRHVLALVILGLGMPAWAQVSIYGVMDLGVEFVRSKGTAAASSGVQRLVSGYASGSRLGFRATEDLGDGLQAVALLESGVEADTGAVSQGGRAFGRQAYVGLRSRLAQVTLGRHMSPLYDFDLDFDPTGIRYSSPIFDLVLNGRYDNSLKARLQISDEAWLSGMYSLGSELSADRLAGRTYALGARANLPRSAAIGISWEKTHGTSTADSRLAVQRVFVGATLAISSHMTAFGAAGRRRSEMNSVSSGRLGWLGVMYRVSPQWTIAPALYALRSEHSAKGGTAYSLYSSYAYSRRTDVYFQVGMVDNKAQGDAGLNGPGTASAGAQQKGAVVGIRHRF